MKKQKTSSLITLSEDTRPLMIHGDVRHLRQILAANKYGEDSIDLICTHPPYLDSIRYNSKSKADLSHFHDVDKFCLEMREIARQFYQALKPAKICTLLIGDLKGNGKLIPLGFRVLQEFLAMNFQLKQIIVKTQWNDSSLPFWYQKNGNKNGPDYLIAHEYLFILQKPEQCQKIG